MFNLSITANTFEELRLKLLDTVNHLRDVEVKKAAEVQEAPKPVITIAQREEAVKNAPVHEMPKPPALEEVRAAMKELRDRKGPDAVREILKAYNATTLSELKEEDYLGALARAKTEV